MQMIITHENLIRLLNMDLELENAAAIQYINHAARLKGGVCSATVQTIKRFAHEKIRNAMYLAELISCLGGFVSNKVGVVRTADADEDMLWYDLRDEEDAVQRLKIRIELARQLREMDLVRRLEEVLKMDQKHIRYLKKQLDLQEDPAQRVRSSPASDFAKEWANRAIRVPIRIKKNELSRPDDLS